MAKAKKRSDGYYCKWYKGKQFLGRTEAEAAAKRDEYKYECEHGIEKQKPITVYDLADQWLPVAKANVGKGTYNQYATVMDKLIEVTGNKLVSAVTPADIKKVWASYKGLSQSYISKAKFLYKSFFQHAIDNNYCRTNPMLAESSKPHRGTKGSHRALTEREISLIESVPHRVQTAAMIMLKAGLRRGEVLALQKKDIHDDRIWISKAISFVNNRPVEGGTKNESSERTVPLFGPLKPFLSSIDKYVLPDEHGKVCSETAFSRAWESYLSDLSAYANGESKRWFHRTNEWKQAHPKEYAHYLELKEKDPAEAEEYRLADWEEISFRPHDLRHTFVTTCRDRGVDLRICIDWCGHSSEKMIIEIYDHPSAQREKNAMKLMDETAV